MGRLASPQVFPAGSSPMRRIALVLLVPVGAFLAYELGVFLWGRHHYRAAEEALDRRDFEAASAHLEKCLDVSPKDTDSRLLAAQAARRQGKFDEARHHLHLFKQAGGSANAL